MCLPLAKDVVGGVDAVFGVVAAREAVRRRMHSRFVRDTGFWPVHTMGMG